MSSIRVDDMAVSDGDLKILDDFMSTLGFQLMPGSDNKSEPANMPWSSRWYRPETSVYTDGKKGSLHFTVDIGQFLYQNVNIKGE